MRRKNKRSYHPYGGKRKPLWRKALLGLLLTGALAFGALFGAVLYGSYDHIRGEPQVMVILGCQVKPWGPSVLLQDRLDKALEYLEDHPDLTIVVSGGQGTDEPISEAQCMYDYLTEHGVDGAQILLEDQSGSTVENLRNSMELLTQEGYDTTADMVVVSNGFHLTRVRMLWDRVCGGDDNLSTLAAPSSHLPSRLKMYIREPLALVKSFVFDR
ncbi:YdcF family protein [uncultured Flavonifractor sp.]|uniref:YdcF family protein n=1 Tax=uncultured Flavonifractor sp. TaxID=1193534 RepID=UPI002606CE07|nr:YdcF family protein [uncultured Flavonifractor sp.]